MCAGFNFSWCIQDHKLRKIEKLINSHYTITYTENTKGFFNFTKRYRTFGTCYYIEWNIRMKEKSTSCWQNLLIIRNTLTIRKHVDKVFVYSQPRLNYYYT